MQVNDMKNKILGVINEQRRLEGQADLKISALNNGRGRYLWKDLDDARRERNKARVSRFTIAEDVKAQRLQEVHDSHLTAGDDPDGTRIRGVTWRVGEGCTRRSPPSDGFSTSGSKGIRKHSYLTRVVPHVGVVMRQREEHEKREREAKAGLDARLAEAAKRNHRAKQNEFWPAFRQAWG